MTIFDCRKIAFEQELASYRPVFLHYSWIFDSGTLIQNCFSWHFMLKNWCLMLIHNIRCFYGPCIRPRMQKNLCFEQCLDLDFIAKVAVIIWLWTPLWLRIRNYSGLFLFSGFFWGNPCEDIHPVKTSGIDCRKIVFEQELASYRPVFSIKCQLKQFFITVPESKIQL